MLESYHPSIVLNLKDRKPKSVKELAELADHYEHFHQRDKSGRDEHNLNSNGKYRDDQG